jgi:hypothetical protein
MGLNRPHRGLFDSFYRTPILTNYARADDPQQREPSRIERSARPSPNLMKSTSRRPSPRCDFEDENKTLVPANITSYGPTINSGSESPCANSPVESQKAAYA